MASRIEDFAVIGNCETMALVGRNGSIDWLCLPRFDSAACFTALLGSRDNGRWLIAPTATEATSTRRYRGNSLVLETTFETKTGSVQIVDALSRRDGVTDLVRVVKGLSGSVEMQTEIVLRFDYGRTIPWASRNEDGRLEFVSGPDRIILDSSVPLRGQDMRTIGRFDIRAGEEHCFAMSWTLSFRPLPDALDPKRVPQLEQNAWEEWASRFKPVATWSGPVIRSLLTLKALTHRETGGIVAAATTSLPELIGGPRNWDYRFCWLRDATFTIYALINGGFLEEARQWRDWLLRAVAGDPDNLQIMYGVGGERRLTEYEIPWLAGYEGSTPVRIGNHASTQLQLDVFGELLDTLYVARKAGLSPDEATWPVERALVNHLAKVRNQPDSGIWEVRGAKRHFTHSKVMTWVAFDRAIRMIEEFGVEGPADEWRHVRDDIHRQVCEHGYNRDLGSFVQSYGSSVLDASLLLLPLVGFLPPDDPRVIGTVRMVEQRLMRHGLLLRYEDGRGSDDLPAGQGVFLACSFWLVDSYVLLGRQDDARDLFERLLTLCNDVGLLAEEYDVGSARQVGNFPQAFSHLALINSAYNLVKHRGPAKDRSK
ncbi:GH15 family glucan-1,4-alpha-glucosidase [Rhizobium binae]|uniref:GH15 family glucan-1,4-alpha-glucosidase n=1 Tax=Rhizobium binae TaxID=1138190 RepID=A0ABV2MT60_9HYPH|nr:glycoside hydrolase family 15 protein [Rhizobium binae]MBX4970030.1 glycoside hydrolase family 15 protein [Rhizobium binae]MBX4994913.1 glycoside hydrolase family 15 protein [Rhizobium binae]NKL52547.1 glycoside hydrolase family 15 protein [Rhizobium leguminosarum bv. viciae]QSY85000.1 glycoside hydrolase family 15 protein [Rhizobium binae]